VLKRIEAQTVASARKAAPSFGEVPQFGHEVHRALEQHGITPTASSLNIYHHMGFLDRDMEIEVAAPVAAASSIDIPLPGGQRITSQVLPAVEVMACLTQQVTDKTVVQAYNAIGTWIQANSYRIVGPAREICQPLDQGDEAGEEARALRHPAISAGDLLLGLLRETNCFASYVLHDLGITLDRARAAVAPAAADAAAPQDMPLDEGSRRAFVLAAEEAKQHGHDYIGTEHILLALLEVGEPALVGTLQGAGVSPEQVRTRVEQGLGDRG
jgi:effector-binding domain-containing protein